MKAAAPLPFDGFLGLLKAHGFKVNVYHYLRLYQLLDAVGGAPPPDRLAGMLCPLFATSEEEQVRFLQLFDRYFRALKSAEPVAAGGTVQSSAAAKSVFRPSKMAVVAAAVVAVLALALVLVWLGGGRSESSRAVSVLEPPPSLAPAPAPVEVPKPPQSPMAVSGESSGTPAPEKVPIAPAETPVAPQSFPLPDRDLNSPPDANEQPRPDRAEEVLFDPDRTWATDRQSFPELVRSYAPFVIGMFGVAAVGYLIFAYISRRPHSFLRRSADPLLRRARKLALPPMRLPDEKSLRLQQIARKLRVRHAAERMQFDVYGSVNATIAAGGYPRFCYAHHTQIPEYLVLIDRVSFRDHQAEYFDHRVASIEGNSVLLIRYYFARDPRVCVDDRGQSHLLRELQRRHASHRLLVFSDGESFLDPLDGTLSHSARGLLHWRDRALLTPEEHWTWRERVLGRYLTLHRATVDGLEELAGRFDGGRASSGIAGQAGRFAAEDVTELSRLRAHLGEPLFRWLSICAIYPDLHWSLTLRLRTVGDLENRAWDEAEMMRLFRLPWFRVGFMPDFVRTHLIETLETQQDTEAREVIVALLDHSLAQTGGDGGLQIQLPNSDEESIESDSEAASEPATEFREGDAENRLDIDLPDAVAEQIESHEPQLWRKPAQRRIFMVYAGLVALFTHFSFQLVDLGVTRHDELAAKAAEKHVTRITIHARRGIIQDVHGESLAQNEPVRDVVADATLIKDRAAMAEVLSAALNVSSAQVAEKLDREVYSKALNKQIPSPYIVLKKDVPEAVAMDLADRLAERKMRGINFEETTNRIYPNDQMLCHVLGYVNGEGMGMDGVERTMEQYLRGHDGFRYTERDRMGKEIVPYRGEERQPRNGFNVRLTIDLGLQNIVEEELGAAVKQLRPKSATVILVEPRTGEILALANRPNFSLNAQSGVPEGHRRNRAISDVTEPGATFGIVTVGGALSEKIVQPTTMIYCENGYFAAYRLRDSKPFGNLSVNEIVSKSSSIGLAKLGIQLGDDKFHTYVRRFGFGERTGVQLPGEIGGIVHPPHRWSKISLSRMSMGYEVAVTPLQTALSMCVIANGGRLMMPQVIREIVDDQGAVVVQFTPQEVRQVISREAAEGMQAGLIDLVSDKGMAPQARIAGYKVAGKTGKAQKYDQTGQITSEKYAVSFVGYVPVENPAFVGLVLIDEAQIEKDNNFGGPIAGSIFSRIGERAMRYLSIAPTSDSQNTRTQPAPQRTR